MVLATAKEEGKGWSQGEGLRRAEKIIVVYNFGTRLYIILAFFVSPTNARHVYMHIS